MWSRISLIDRNHRIVHKHPAFIVFLYIIEHLYEITQCQMEQKEARNMLRVFEMSRMTNHNGPGIRSWFILKDVTQMCVVFHTGIAKV